MEKDTSLVTKSTVNTCGVVRAWSEVVMLPTYEIGEEEKNPMFLERRIYQGSSGVVYPYPIVEKISDEKIDKAYNVVFIENQYIKVMIMPELGGRIQMAYDKVKQRHFVYYNQVIKPALVGLLGPWISGGIEFNWPQHHRPTTYLPTDVRIENNSDGSITVWCSEIERMFRIKGMQGFTLHPDKAYIEINVRVYNRTPLPQTFLWWANPAVAVNDSYKSVFPPDVYAVFDHGKRDVSDFPIATGVYYKKDYSVGVDISKYKNISVPTSYMAINSNYDFVGGYEDGVKGGLLHVANHHISPGKKQWTWGNGDFGAAWDRNLTDEDGPYIELMTGVFTDNQPDFSWLHPYEEKSWTQYFMPYTEVGYVKNASKDIIMNIEVSGGSAVVIVYATSKLDNLRIELKTVEGKILLDKIACLSPETQFSGKVSVVNCDENELILSVYDSNSNVMLRYQAQALELKPMPEPAKKAQEPHEYKSVEQLFLVGHHLEQYRHATYDPLDYYFEALKREPSDVRCNNAVGLLLIRRGKFAQAESYLRAAVKTLTDLNPNPYDGEPLYNLAWALKLQGKTDQAYDMFYKSTWNAAWQDAGFFGVAQIDSLRGKWDIALEALDKSLVRNWHNHKARALKVAILRKMGAKEEALKLVEESLLIDGFNAVLLYEKYLLTGDKNFLTEMNDLMRGCQNSYMEYSIDYATAGLYCEAIEFLSLSLKDDSNYPMVMYSLGYFYSQKGDKSKAKEFYRSASELCPDRCFPNKIEEVNILYDAIEVNPEDPKAPFYLGNLYYGAHQYMDAISLWELSMSIDDKFPTTLRNLSLAYYNKLNNKAAVRPLLEKAFELDTSDSRILMELDQLYKKLGVTHQERLSLLDKYINLVEQRDDIYIERITLLNLMGRYSEAMDLMTKRKFHPWEGGEGKVIGQYVICRMELAKIAINECDFESAIELLKEAMVYPHNLGEGKLDNAQENEILYYLGVAYRGLADESKAVFYFEWATKGLQEPVQAFFYNDQQPDKIFYQGLAWRALGEQSQAQCCFNKLISHGKRHLFDNCRIDYFAVSLSDLVIWDDDMNVRNKIHCYYVMALGYCGLGDRKKADEYYAKVKELDVNKQIYWE